MADSNILDHRGLPFKKADLSTAIATSTMAGVRNIWSYGTEAEHVTPQRLGSILREAAEGNADAYLTLAEEMEERDLHYASVLGTRKRAISGLDIHVEAASEDANDIKIADAVRELIKQPEFIQARDELLDALGKSYSVVEINWHTKQTPWMPSNRWVQKDGEAYEEQGYTWRDPRFFQYDKTTGTQLRLKDEADITNGIALPPYRFIVHQPRLKTGLPIRGGLARLVAVAYMCKSYTITDWMAFAEVFGMPVRIGKYGHNASETDIATLVNAVANIGSDAAAVIPDSMKIDFEAAANSQGAAELFKNLADWLDRQVSKAVLGQTASTEGTPGKLGNDDAQDEVRQDILKADAKALDATINRDLVRAFVDLNFGVQKAYPLVEHLIVEQEDIEGLTNALEKLVPLGLQVDQAVMRDKLGLPAPDKDAVLLSPQATAPAITDTPALNQALNREQANDIDDIEAEALENWQEQIDPVLAPVRELLEASETAEEFAEGLAELLEDMDDSTLQKALALAMFKAHLTED